MDVWPSSPIMALKSGRIRAGEDLGMGPTHPLYSQRGRIQPGHIGGRIMVYAQTLREDKSKHIHFI